MKPDSMQYMESGFFNFKLSYLRVWQSICMVAHSRFFTADQSAQYLSPFADCPDGLFGIGL